MESFAWTPLMLTLLQTASLGTDLLHHKLAHAQPPVAPGLLQVQALPLPPLGQQLYVICAAGGAPRQGWLACLTMKGSLRKSGAAHEHTGIGSSRARSWLPLDRGHPHKAEARCTVSCAHKESSALISQP